MPRENITFKCSVCGEENYIGTRNKRKHTEKMEIKKYCPRCNKMTLHKENGYMILTRQPMTGSTPHPLRSLSPERIA